MVGLDFFCLFSIQVLLRVIFKNGNVKKCIWLFDDCKIPTKNDYVCIDHMNQLSRDIGNETPQSTDGNKVR